MASGVELATAWVRLTFSAEGSQKAIENEIDKADLDGAGDKGGKRYSSGFSSAAKVGLAAGAAVAVAGLVKVFQTGMEEIKFGEQISAQTDQLIENTRAGFTTQWVEDYTLALSKVSGISEEDLQSAGNAVLKFGDVSEDTYARSVDAINNMGSAGKDVAGVGEALGKALADPAAAAGLLKRQGVILNEEQQKLIDNFVAVGDKAGAQGVILDGLESTYGGMAEATGGTMQGNLNKLSNMFENLSATVVETLMPSLVAVVGGLSGFFSFLQDNPALVQMLAIAVGVLAAAFIALSVAMWLAALNPVGIIIGLIILAVAALVAAIIFLVMNWDQVWAAVMNALQVANDWIVTVLEGFVGWWNGLWTTVWEFIVSIWESIVSSVTGFINNLALGLMIIGAQIANWWNSLWSGIVNFFVGAWNNIMNVITTIQSVFGSVFSAIAGIVSGAFQGVVGVIRGVINNIVGLVNGVIRGINSVAGAVGSAIGVSISIPTIPGLATGGTITRSGVVQVGERGPELLRLPRGASVDPDISNRPGDVVSLSAEDRRLLRNLETVVTLGDDQVSASAGRGTANRAWRGGSR